MASIGWQLASAARDALAGVSGLSGAQVRIRKRPFFSKEHGDAYPMVCVSILPEKILGTFMPAGLRMRYILLVAIFQAVGSTLADPVSYQWQTDRREDFRQALFVPALGGVPGVHDCGYDAGPVYDLGALGNLHDISLQTFSYDVAESRTQG